MKRLIINADDFGLTPGVNWGIVRAFREGILTSTTVMAGAPAFEHAVGLARENPDLSVGCHLVLLGGRAVAEPCRIPSLIDGKGFLPASLPQFLLKIATGRIPAEEIICEFRAQIARLLDCGVKPSHLDSHKHTHCFPPVMRAVAFVAEEFGIRRWRKPFESRPDLLAAGATAPNGRVLPRQFAAGAAAYLGASAFQRLKNKYNLLSPDHFYGIMATGHLGPDALVSLIERLPEGISELMCHPGICDEQLERTDTRLKRQREIELQALLHPGARRALDHFGVQIISYRELN